MAITADPATTKQLKNDCPHPNPLPEGEGENKCAAQLPFSPREKGPGDEGKSPELAVSCRICPLDTSQDPASFRHEKRIAIASAFGTLSTQSLPPCPRTTAAQIDIVR